MVHMVILARNHERSIEFIASATRWSMHGEKADRSLLIKSAGALMQTGDTIRPGVYESVMSQLPANQQIPSTPEFGEAGLLVADVAGRALLSRIRMDRRSAARINNGLVHVSIGKPSVV